MKVSWKDWWASRSIRLMTYLTVINGALMSVLPFIDAPTLSALGLSQNMVLLVMLPINVIIGLRGIDLRAKTKPLAGRSSTGNGYDEPEEI